MSEPTDPEYIHRNILVEIIGDHPHAGEKGHPIGSDKDHIAIVMDMYQIHLVDCQHGTGGCFAKAENLKMLVGPSQTVMITGRVTGWKTLEEG